MKADIWITTYQRPELLSRCIASLEGVGRMVRVLHPTTDEYDLPEGFVSVPTPDEITGIGAGAVRKYACEMAIEEGHGAVIFVEDDVRVPKPEVLDFFIEDFENYANLATAQWRGAFPPGKRLPYAEHLAVFWSTGGCFAVRLDPYVEVGGYDTRIIRMEDIDLCLRLRVACYDMSRDLRVSIAHTPYQPGGTTALEGPGDDRKEVAIRVRKECAEHVVAKWPEDSLRINKNGWISFRKGRLEELQHQYMTGQFILTVEGPEYI